MQMSLWEQNAPLFVKTGESSGGFNGGVQNREWSELYESHDVNGVHMGFQDLGYDLLPEGTTTVNEQAEVPFGMRNDQRRRGPHPLKGPELLRRKHGSEELYKNRNRFDARSAYFVASVGSGNEGRKAVQRWERLSGTQSRPIREMDGS